MNPIHMFLGQIHPVLAVGLLIIMFLVMAGSMMGIVEATIENEKIWPFGVALLLSAVYLFSIAGGVPGEGRYEYMASDKSLAALNVAQTIENKSETDAGLLYYVSRSQTGETWTYSVIQMTEDDKGQEYAEIRTYPADKVRVYQNSSVEPRVVEYRSHEKIFGRFSFEWKYDYNELEYVELTVPEGSIVEGYSVDITESQNG